MGRDFDIAIVGGGLAGGLIALALRRHAPDVSVGLFEAGEVLGGNHRWSWFDADLDEDGRALLAPFRKTVWDGGYDVRFPGYERHLPSAYNSLASTEFDAALLRELGQQTVHCSRRVEALSATGIRLANGGDVTARTVIDCRDGADWSALNGGWQVFMGRHVRTPGPHGIPHPIVMDAAVPQLAPCANGPDNPGAYRFVYVLPLGVDEVFVEDTYYADDPVLDRSALSGRIDEYCNAHGLQGEILGHETGVLPVITGGDFVAFRAANAVPGVVMAGARGGFVHPLTSYTLPFAAQTALAIAREAELPGEQLAALVEAQARRHWSATGFYRMLGQMLFGAADPAERYRIFARFYRLKPGLVERFYAGQSSAGEKLRILSGKPPVSVSSAVRALMTQRPPLKGPS
ncbi:lycopene beta-cyclase CrtY [Paraurantiacibacter namhicola]|uniref:Lycopene cyclase protein n=1 Tax=Paraurantiacibacter namhicola TaxID=645517 RepID=A0A1C7D7A7_9SPHN|nr:lycopene beta-cyclase CrtY [Paraurantiacibacter namhicola]ANU07242.1 Lycopene cyclase protein [Paraurantiacibacter namhicola]